MAGGILLMAIAALGLLWKMHRSLESEDRFSAALCRVSVFVGEYVAFVLLALLLVASFVLGDAVRLAAYIQRLRPLLLGGVLSLGLCLLYPAVFDKSLLSYTHKVNQQPESSTSAVWQPPLALAVVALLVYLAAGIYTEWSFILANPLPARLHYDFGYYMQGLDAALAGGSPYTDLSLGTGFLYPLPSLLVVEVFAHLPVVWLRQGLYLLFNLALLGGMLWGVARYYRLSLRQVWWWFPPGVGLCSHAGNAARRADQHDHRVWSVPALHLGGVTSCMGWDGVGLGHCHQV